MKERFQKMKEKIRQNKKRSVLIGAVLLFMAGACGTGVVAGTNNNKEITQAKVTEKKQEAKETTDSVKKEAIGSSKNKETAKNTAGDKKSTPAASTETKKEESNKTKAETTNEKKQEGTKNDSSASGKKETAKEGKSENKVSTSTSKDTGNSNKSNTSSNKNNTNSNKNNTTGNKNNGNSSNTSTANSGSTTGNAGTGGTANNNGSGNSGNSNGNTKPSTPQPTPTPEPPAHVHDWQYVPATGHDEPDYITVTDYLENPIYETKVVCGCGAIFDSVEGKDGWEQHSIDGCGYGYSSMPVEVGTDKVAIGSHQEPTGTTHWVQDSAAYTYCTGCGARK